MACESANTAKLSQYTATNSSQLKMSECKILFRDPTTGTFDGNNPRSINVKWDTRASCNIIAPDLAEELGYKGEPTHIETKKFNENNELVTKSLPTQLYNVYIMDREKTAYKIEAHGYQNLGESTPLKRSAVKRYAGRFGVPASKISNTSGPTDMIINQKSLLPELKLWRGKKHCDLTDGFGLYYTKFGEKPYILAGKININERVNPQSPVEYFHDE